MAAIQFEKAVEHARPLPQMGGVPGEGDTKSNLLLKSTGTSRLFADVFAGLADIDDRRIAEEMARRYERMNLRIAELRKILLP